MIRFWLVIDKYSQNRKNSLEYHSLSMLQNLRQLFAILMESNQKYINPSFLLSEILDNNGSLIIKIL